MSSEYPTFAPAPDSDDDHSLHSTLEQLWESAIARYRKEHDKDEATLELYQAIRSCPGKNAILELVHDYSKNFADFRGVGGKPKEVISRLVKILLDLSEPSADVAGTAVLGGKFVIAAVASLLRAVNTVSETYEAIERALEKIKTALESYESVLDSTFSISHTMSERLVKTFVTILDFLGAITTHCKIGISETKRKWAKVFKERLKDFGAAILKDPKVGEKLKALDEAMNAEDKQLLVETHTSARDAMNALHVLIRDREYTAMKTWIAPPEHSTIYTNHLDKKHEDTCDWILDEESFRDWKYRSGSFYEILGKAGSGKSVLCSRIVEHLLDNTDDSPAFSLAYFFFDATIPTQRTHRALLSSLLFQIASSSESCWERLRAEYKKFGRSGPPAIKKLSTTLADLLELSGPMCIVVDALDECQTANNDQINTLKLIVELQKLNLPAVHILVTSRPEHRITLHLQALKEKASLDLASSDMHYRDLEAYVSACLDSAEYNTLEWSPELRESVQAKLCSAEKSEGIFLWVELQLRILCDTLPRNVPAKLEMLLPDLAGTFCGILDRFSGDSPVKEILGLIAVAEQPLTVQQVTAAFAFDFDRGEVHAIYSDSNNHSQRDLTNAKAFVLRYLPALVEVRRTWDWDSSEMVETVHFIHFSVKEYLTGGGPICDAKPPLRYLIDAQIASLQMAILLVVAMTDSGELGDLIPYGHRWWFHYVQLAVNNGELDFADRQGLKARHQEASVLNNSLAILLGHPDVWGGKALDVSLSLIPPYGAFDSVNLARFDNLSSTYLTPLHVAVELGLSGHVERLLARDPDVDKTSRHIPITALFWAVARTSCKAQLQIIDFLLSRGAARMHNVQDKPGILTSSSSLMHAARYAPNKSLILSHLLTCGVDIDARDILGETALHHAAWRDERAWLEVLLAHGANPNALDVEGKTPLILAVGSAGEGGDDVLRLLLHAGVQLELCSPGNFTALQWAAIHGKPEARNFLISAGANAQGLVELEELGVKAVDGGADWIMGTRLAELEKMRRLRYAEGLPPLSLSEQRKILHPPPELVELPADIYWPYDETDYSSDTDVSDSDVGKCNF